MKKVFKLALVLLILGIGLAIGSLVFLGGDLTQITARFNADDEYSLVERNVDIDCESIDVLAMSRQIIITTSDREDIYLKYYESEDDYFTFTETTSDIQLERVNRPFWFNFSFFPRFLSEEVQTILIDVPSDYDGALVLETINGSIEVSNLNLPSLRAITTNGTISLTGLTVLGTFEAVTTNGDVNGSLLEASGTITLSTTNGQVNVTNIMALRVEASSTNGRVNLQHVNSQNIRATSTNGSVITRVDGQKSSYRIDVGVVNGSISVDGLDITSQIIHPSLQPTLYAHTVNGSVNITFEAE